MQNINKPEQQLEEMIPYSAQLLEFMYNPQQTVQKYCFICTRKNQILIKIDESKYLCQECINIYRQQNNMKIDLQVKNQLIQAQKIDGQTLLQNLQQYQEQQKQIPDYYINLAMPFQESIDTEYIQSGQYDTVLQPTTQNMKYNHETDILYPFDDIIPMLVPVFFTPTQPHTVYQFNQCIVCKNIPDNYQLYFQISTPDQESHTYQVKYDQQQQKLITIKFALRSTIHGVYNIQLFFIPQHSQQRVFYYNTRLLSIELSPIQYQISYQSSQLLKSFVQYFEKIKQSEYKLQIDDINCIVVMLQSSINGKQTAENIKILIDLAENQQNIRVLKSDTMKQNIFYQFCQYNQFPAILDLLIQFCQKVDILQQFCANYKYVHTSFQYLADDEL